jgi:hypothetical protein
VKSNGLADHEREPAEIGTWPGVAREVSATRTVTWFECVPEPLP